MSPDATATPTHHEDALGPAPAAPRPGAIGLLLLALGVAIVLAGLFLLGYVPRHAREQSLDAESERIRTALPRVATGKAKRSPASTDLQLPGTIQAFQETTLYARNNGYLKRWLVDIGDEVKVGQLLAEIDSPEVDQMLNQALASLEQTKARLATAQANVALANSSLQRYTAASEHGGISVQEIAERQAALDVSHSNVEAAKADILAAEANVKRLQELQSFSRILAPFSGVITQRTVEIGQLVTGGSTGQSQALFHIAQVDPVRVFVNVPQMYSTEVRTGQTATLTLREYPRRTFDAKVTRTSRSLDPASRTLMTEMVVSNKDGALLVGMYAQVKFAVIKEDAPLLVPASALIVNEKGTQLAIVGPGNKVLLKQVFVEGDYGTFVGIASGITTEDAIILNPGERISEGTAVSVDAPPAPPPLAANGSTAAQNGDVAK